MILSKRSVVHMLFVVMCAASLLFSLPYSSKAAESSENPNWMSGSITTTIEGERTYSETDDTSAFANIPCETKNAYSWSWQNDGWSRWKLRTLQVGCVIPSLSGYLGFRQLLPFGSQYWQTLDVSNYYHAWTLPNPGTNGMGIITNAYADYAAIPSELYYTGDAFATFSTYSQDSVGNVVRSPSKAFEYKLTYPDGRAFQINDKGSVSYSANGNWMYVNGQGSAQLRINTDNFSVFSFAPSLTHQYAEYTSITNSGNTVATYSYGTGLRLYDLTSCDAEKPDYGSRDCASRDLEQIAKDAYGSIGADGPVYIEGVKFQTESRLRLTLRYQKGGETKTGFMDLKVAVGEQSMRYLALGDSFSSGEGAGNYYKTTNFWISDDNHNRCHQSKAAYSVLLNTALHPVYYGSAACSGAKMEDVVSGSDDSSYAKDNPSQARSPLEVSLLIDNVKHLSLPGYIPQSSLVQANFPTVATITIGGNDIGFSSIVTMCVFSRGGDCSTSRDQREMMADVIASKIPELAATYATVKNDLTGSNPKLYVIGYPYMFAEQRCASFMSLEEQKFANRLVDYLNAAIQMAATRAGVSYIDVSRAFINDLSGEDHRLCGNAAQAANGLFYDALNMSDGEPFMDGVVSSYHPNALGHSLLANTIELETDDFRQSMPRSPAATDERPAPSLYTALVGDSEDHFEGLGSVSQSITKDVVVEDGQSVSVSYSIGTDDAGLPVENATITVVAESTPVTLGTVTVGSDGTANGTFQLPASLEPGIHTIHLLYTDISGQAHDVYQYILVVASMNDFDGDGTPNDQGQCVMGGTMDVDRDKDGIDDACDPEIAEKVTVLDTTNTNSSEYTDSRRTNANTSTATTTSTNNLTSDVFTSSLGFGATNPTTTSISDGTATSKATQDKQPATDATSWLYIIISLIALLVLSFVFGIYQARKRL